MILSTIWRFLGMGGKEETAPLAAFPGPVENLELSILIPTLKSRSEVLERLVLRLDEQVRASGPVPTVEVLIAEDAGELTVGAKRTKLLSEARGCFVVFIDDDDEISDDYVSSILQAIRRNPEARSVGFRGIMTVDGGPGRQVVYSARVKDPILSEGVYLRQAGHLTPIRREIAQKYAFRSVSQGEDIDWARRMAADLQADREVFLDRVLYHYRYRSAGTATQKGAPSGPMGIDPSIFHVAILSANPENLRRCLRSIFERDPGIHPSRVVVVDDGVGEACRREFPQVSWAQGVKPFVFARNANVALSALTGDVILLNDDARLLTRFGLSSLSFAARAREDIGIVGAVSEARPSVVPYGAERGILDESGMFAFVCVYIKRSTIARVGLLDERFTGYGYDDNDYCLRVQQAGLKLGIYGGTRVLHGDPQISSYRSRHDWQTLSRANRELYEAKWGPKK